MSSFLTIFSSIIIGSTCAPTFQCANKNDCNNHDLSERSIECSGYNSCDNSKLTYSALEGDIECSAYSSCITSLELISEKGDIYCSGEDSCSSSEKIDGKNIECTASDTCSKVPTIISNAFTYCQGYNSCFSSTIQSKKAVYCDGINSCKKSTIQSDGDILCTGYKSCFRGSYTANNKNNIICSGSSGCGKGKFTADYIESNGYKTGKSSTFTANTVIGNGWDSLIGATIQTLHDSTKLTVHLSKSSGKYATIICLNGIDCSIKCNDFCNEHLVIVAHINAVLTVNSADNLCDLHGELHGELGGCPEIKIFSSKNEIDNYLVQRQLDISTHVQESEETEETDISTHVQESAVECNLAQECENQQINNANLVCAGFEACLSSEITDTNAKSTKCYGTDSCNTASLNSNGIISCFGANSCANSQQLIGSSIECSGFESCVNSAQTIKSDALKCSGAESCKHNIVNTNTLYATAKDACFGGTAKEVSNIYCDGSNACASGDFHSTAKLECRGLESCQDSLIQNSGTTIKFEGEKSGYKARIIGMKIRALGYKSVASATIQAEFKKITVQLWGNLAGYEATVMCYAGNNCFVDCKSDGCKNLKFKIFWGSTAKVKPDCLHPDRPEQINGVDCPIIITSLSEEMDYYILNNIEYSNYSNGYYYGFVGMIAFVMLCFLYYKLSNHKDSRCYYQQI